VTAKSLLGKNPRTTNDTSSLSEAFSGV